MLAALIVLAAALVLVCGVLLVKASALSGRLKHRVVVHTKDDRSVRGVLMANNHDAITIGTPEYLDEANPTELPGEVLVLKANVSFVQVLA